jgi:leucyl aminopeptidase
MPTVHRTPDLTVTSQPAKSIDADLLAIPLFEDDDLADEPGLDEASAGEIGQARARGELRGTLYDVFGCTLHAGGWTTMRAVLIGAGRRADFDAERARRFATVAGLAARQRRLARLAIIARAVPAKAGPLFAQAMTEGAVLANFDGGAYKTGEAAKAWLDVVTLRVEGTGRELQAAVERGRVLGECSNLARELANEPGNYLPPRVLADRAAAVARDAGLEVDVLDEARIRELRMGLLLGVARGSEEPPRLLVLRHTPAKAPDEVTLGLVGKGVTFDTGGISIKPAENMDKMKDDMSGAAAVLGAMAAIARLGAPVRCVGVIPMAENMPGATACKPGDILTGASGQTVEVLNTDAEGRLILGDAVWYARQLGATHLVDVATLTGACVVALGKTTTGLFGTPDAWVDVVRQASARAGDRAWPLPVFDDYREQLKSEIADFSNTGGRPAGAITGALFIREFTDGLPWVHLDIAGTAWAEEAKPYQPKGATGVAVRTLAELALGVGGWSKLKLQG